MSIARLKMFKNNSWKDSSITENQKNIFDRQGEFKQYRKHNELPSTLTRVKYSMRHFIFVAFML